MKAKAYIVHQAMCEPELEWRKPKDCLFAEPLYAKREWVGLTGEEKYRLYCSPMPLMALIEEIEDKLKGKNL